MTYDVYDAFGNKIRTKLILCLSHGSKNVTELIGTCKLSQSAVSQHLRKLKQARLVKTEKSGKEIYYSLTYKSASAIAKLLIHLEEEVV